MQMSPLVKVDKRLVDFAVLLRQRDFVSCDVVGHLQMATRAFKFLEMIGDVFGGDKLMSEDGAHQFSAQRIFPVSYRFHFL